MKEINEEKFEEICGGSPVVRAVDAVVDGVIAVGQAAGQAFNELEDWLGNL